MSIVKKNAALDSSSLLEWMPGLTGVGQVCHRCLIMTAPRTNSQLVLLVVIERLVSVWMCLDLVDYQSRSLKVQTVCTLTLYETAAKVQKLNYIDRKTVCPSRLKTSTTLEAKVTQDSGARHQVERFGR